MNTGISPKYRMKLVEEIDEAIWNEYKSYFKVEQYLSLWQEQLDQYTYNFEITRKQEGTISLRDTLTEIARDSHLLLQIAMDLGIDTPGFIPAIPNFKDSLKTRYPTCHESFMKASDSVLKDPGAAVGWANSTLESLIKEILLDERFEGKIAGSQSLIKLIKIILQEFKLSSDEFPNEIGSIVKTLTVVSTQIDNLRSDKSGFHGPSSDQYVVSDSIYAALVVNSAATVGIFLDDYYRHRFPKPPPDDDRPLVTPDDDLPF